MKHVFSVTSHLTYSLARRIAMAGGIPFADCVLLLLRDYHLPPQGEADFAHRIATSYNVDTTTGRVFAGARFWQTRRNIRQFDAMVDTELRGEDFCFYTSVCSNDVCSLMVSKPNCKGFYVTEDGLSSYRDTNPQTFTGPRYWMYRLVLKPLFPRIFEAKNHFIEDRHPKFRGCIATSDKCFPLHRDRLRVVGNPFEPLVVSNPPDAIISVDPLYNDLDHTQVEGLYAALARLMAPKGYSRVAYKLHPRFNAASNAEHKRFFAGVLERCFPGIAEIPPDVVLENLLAGCRADFYSCDSSVAIYASVAGARCYSIMPLLEGTPAYVPHPFMQQFQQPVTN